MELGGDVLDNQIVDRHGARLGKVDGVVLAVEDGRAPRVVALEVGAATFVRRIHRGLGGWLARLARRRRLPFGRVTRIPWARVTRVGLDIQVDLDAERTAAHAFERWLRTRVIARVPGLR